MELAAKIGGGAMSIMFLVCPYFFCSSGSEADVWKPSEYIDELWVKLAESRYNSIDYKQRNSFIIINAVIPYLSSYYRTQHSSVIYTVM